MTWRVALTPTATRDRVGSTDDPEPPWPSTEFNEWSYRALSILSTKGKEPIVVLDAWLPKEWKCVPGVDFLGWSPDSRHAFAASYWPCAGGCASPVGVTDRVLQIDVSSGHVEETWRGSNAALGHVTLSPNGRWIAGRSDGSGDDVFSLRLIATGAGPDRTARLDVHKSVFPDRAHILLHGPWSIDWQADSTAVRVRYSIDVCTGKPVYNGWLRYDLGRGAFEPDGQVLEGEP